MLYREKCHPRHARCSATTTTRLRPLAEEAHESHARHEGEHRAAGEEWTRVHEVRGRVHPVLRPHLDDADPDENTTRDGVEDRNGEDGVGIVAVELVDDTDADGHAEGRDESESAGQDALLSEGEVRGLDALLDARSLGGVLRSDRSALGALAVCRHADRGRRNVTVRVVSADALEHLLLCRLGSQSSDTASKGKALEDLVEDDDDEQGQEEAVTCDNQGDTDN